MYVGYKQSFYNIQCDKEFFTLSMYRHKFVENKMKVCYGFTVNAS